MRVTLLPLLLAGAGVFQSAAASPIRVVIVSGNNDAPARISLDAPSFFVEKMIRPEVAAIPVERPLTQVQPITSVQPPKAHSCHSLKNKAIDVSNKFRQMLGLPLITHGEELLNVTLVHPIPATPRPLRNGGVLLPIIHRPLPPQSAGQSPDGRVMHHHHHHGGRTSAVHRLHRALMVLGPWEGRAVAFVLGCGIGVLIRMFWVLAIVVVRSFRGNNRSEDDEVEHILIFERDAEPVAPIVVQPPPYYDEKAPLVDDGDKKGDATA